MKRQKLLMSMREAMRGMERVHSSFYRAVEAMDNHENNWGYAELDEEFRENLDKLMSCFAELDEKWTKKPEKKENNDA